MATPHRGMMQLTATELTARRLRVQAGAYYICLRLDVFYDDFEYCRELMAQKHPCLDDKISIGFVELDVMKQMYHHNIAHILT